MDEQDLIEQLADRIHESWSHWMQYVFTRCEKQADGSVLIPAGLVERWQRQIETPYAYLSEGEKQSDRNEVMPMLPLIRRHTNGTDY